MLKGIAITEGAKNRLIRLGNKMHEEARGAITDAMSKGIITRDLPSGCGLKYEIREALVVVSQCPGA